MVWLSISGDGKVLCSKVLGCSYRLKQQINNGVSYKCGRFVLLIVYTEKIVS